MSRLNPALPYLLLQELETLMVENFNKFTLKVLITVPGTSCDGLIWGEVIQHVDLEGEREGGRERGREGREGGREGGRGGREGEGGRGREGEREGGGREGGRERGREEGGEGEGEGEGGRRTSPQGNELSFTCIKTALHSNKCPPSSSLPVQT